MATTDNAPRSRKRIEATVLKHARDGSAFTRCEACNKDVAIILIDLHSYSLDSKICLSLGSIFQRLEVNGRHKPTREYIDRECNGVKPPNNFGEVDPWTAWAYIPRTILLLLMGTCFLISFSGGDPLMAICFGHSSSSGGAAPMMVDSSTSRSCRRGDEARPRLQPPPIIDELIFFH